MPIFTRERFSKWLWIAAVIVFIGFFRLHDDFGLMVVWALVVGGIVLFVKAFIWAARNNQGVLLQDENGKLYRAFEVNDSSSGPLDEDSPFSSYRDDVAHPFSHYHDDD